MRMNWLETQAGGMVNGYHVEQFAWRGSTLVAIMQSGAVVEMAKVAPGDRDELARRMRRALRPLDSLRLIEIDSTWLGYYRQPIRDEEQ